MTFSTPSDELAPKWVRFDSTGPSDSGRTHTWSVRSIQGNIYLGAVKWFGQWRRYAFYPDEATVFEQDCLRDIAAFCETQTTGHRQLRATGRREATT